MHLVIANHLEAQIYHLELSKRFVCAVSKMFNNKTVFYIKFNIHLEIFEASD